MESSKKARRALILFTLGMLASLVVASAGTIEIIAAWPDNNIVPGIMTALSLAACVLWVYSSVESYAKTIAEGAVARALDNHPTT